MTAGGEGQRGGSKSEYDHSNRAHHRYMRKSGSRIHGALIFGIIVATIEMALLLWLIYG